ncbi:MAG: hypothetical protein WA209_05400, partial [Candidatus Acidiferrales bacterium]
MSAFRNRRYGEFTKAIEPVFRADPNAAFTIFENTSDEIAGETFGRAKTISHTLMQVQQAFG